MDFKDKNEEFVNQDSQEDWAEVKRDTSLLDRLYEQYGSVIYSRCLILFGNEALAKETTPYILLKSYVHLEEHTNLYNEASFIKQLTCKLCLDIALQAKERCDFSVFSKESLEKKQTNHLFEDRILSLSLKHLKKLLSQVPIGDKILLALTYQDDLSLKAIARLLELSEGDVIKKFNNAQHCALSIQEAILSEK